MSADSLEVRRSCLGVQWVRRYAGASLSIENPLGNSGFGRSLTVTAGGKKRVLSVGDASDIRALGTFLARHTGWRLRNCHAEPKSKSRPSFAPLAGLFILGGLVVAGTGFRQYREGAALPHRLGTLSASDLQSATTGTQWLLTGRIEGVASDDQHLALYDRYVHQYRARGGDSWELADSHRPEFSLYDDSGVTRPISGQSRLVRPPHEWTDGFERFEGFRRGDLATVVGSVGGDGLRRRIEARLIFGGTALQLGEVVRRAGTLGMAIGAGSILLGVALLGGLGRSGSPRPR